jgi:hypothetical protein
MSLSITYGNGSFIAVGSSGTILQSGPAPGIGLSTGWNFISLPNQPQNTAIEAVLGNAAGSTVIVWGYDNQNKAWKKWKPQGAGNTLTDLESGKGYWIYVTAPATIVTTGWAAPSTNVHLYPGWNLVGYAGTDNRYVPTALSGLSGPWSVVWNYEGSRWAAKSQSVTALPVEILDTFRQMKAYWIKIDREADWVQ